MVPALPGDSLTDHPGPGGRCNNHNGLAKGEVFILNGYLIWMFFITGISMITALTVGHGNIAVTLYGARIFLMHFPLIFIIGSVFNREDVIKMGGGFMDCYTYDYLNCFTIL
jgi:hypothetical protein